MIKVGYRLQEARIEKSLTLLDVSKATKIRVEFLKAIEMGRYDRLPSPTYVQGFVRNYAKFLGLPENQILAVFRREFDAEKAYEVLPKGLPRTGEFSIKRIKIGRNFLLAGIAVSALLIFIFYQYRYAFLKPALEIKEPKSGEVINSLYLTVSGKTDRDATVFVDDEAVVIGDDGSFKKTLTFFPGQTIVNIKVVNRFGRQASEAIPVNIKPAP